jgi:hypothetical protein
MQCSAIFRDFEIEITFFVGSCDVHSKIEQLPNAVRIPITGKLGEERSALRKKFLEEMRFTADNRVGT